MATQELYKPELYKRMETIVGNRLEAIEQWLSEAKSSFEDWKDSENKLDGDEAIALIDRFNDIEVGARDVLKVIDAVSEKDTEKALKKVEKDLGINI
jgi:hypothetical protein